MTNRLMTNIHMTPRLVASAITADEAREAAIDWQNWASEQNLSYGELAAFQEAFGVLAARFPELQEEFEENGII